MPDRPLILRRDDLYRQIVPGLPTEHVVDRELVEKFHRPSEDALLLLAREQQPGFRRITVPRDPKLHLFLRKVRACVPLPTNGEGSPDKNRIHVFASPLVLDRALRIMNAILCALEKRGFRVAVRDEHLGTGVYILGAFVRFSLREELRRVYLSKKARAELGPNAQWTFRGTGRLRLTIYASNHYHRRRRWRDTSTRRLERVLKNFIRGLILVADGEHQIGATIETSTF